MEHMTKIDTYLVFTICFVDIDLNKTPFKFINICEYSLEAHCFAVMTKSIYLPFSLLLSIAQTKML